MVITRKKLKGLVEAFDYLFPEPDPDAKAEDSVGMFADMFPRNKSSVEIIREERARIFGVEEPEESETDE